ncbi:MAG: tRNA preQ1(34) S-adenosylmethionine ribosyltransferase-isomerase QueA [Clostridiales Family XIII bacterium]|jgi:S-adenosylmethionine:tRNA ribosyltransferase-isomerase|nr:tRNA preQ1(34) S-adenosylmethionine ribosyltransferase-isomerase QueA [Clostridiales Family XIII bacterium]
MTELSTLSTDLFDYELPRELIAQYPAEKRDESRLLLIDRESEATSEGHFSDILDYLHAGDVLVFNDSKVMRARLIGVKAETGAKIELFLIKNSEGDIWEVLAKPGRRLHVGDKVLFGGGGNSNSDSEGDFAELSAEIIDKTNDGFVIVRFDYEGIFLEVLERLGHIPLPPYIDREDEASDAERYQTVYSKVLGSQAAPTAGLHWTDELLSKVREKGVETAFLTLHVGLGTFRPVQVDDASKHHMHEEEFCIDDEAADTINRAKREGRRVICVGTTSVRTIESAALQNADGLWQLKAGSGSTDIFIYPGYEWKLTDALITNFHLPKSTLLMLVSALYDREKVLGIYEAAVEEKFRFFSYGDAMFIY